MSSNHVGRQPTTDSMHDPHRHQRRYWKELVALRTHTDYLHLYQLEAQAWDNRVNIFLAITSNTSIAAWAVWGRIPLLWATLIGLSQLVTAVKGYLPYQRRIKQLAEVNSDLERLYLFAESRWYSVSEGELDNAEINELIAEIKRRKLKTVDEHLRITPLPPNEALLSKAEDEATKYFESTLAEDPE